MLIIGEKLNSTRERVRKMIENRDVKSIQELARKQVEGGANILDVNASAASGNSKENMKWLVKTVQEVAAVPLCIDSPNAEEIEKGLAAHNWANGKAFINSVTGEKEKMDRLLPSIKNYKCAVVALVMDERGIPDNAQTRIEIARKLIQVLTDSGVPLADIYIDPLAVPIGTNDQNGLIVLDTIRGVKEIYPEVKTVIGLSNISYGLPERKLINQVFMILTMSCGMNAAIIDPTDKRLIAMIKTSLTLLGKDNYCCEYIKAYREGRLTADHNSV
ncbi:MAG: methyltetrahydrofolate cobalamin methyltransferase [Atribacterota bacterium]|nr:methyltetrahydrofolate cobalamin methyltransferase [Atribacterota bacterium]MDD4895324.1 methyltetrahydrofolate cobalamin methyltransferase [Atribacterota bacterium]MDD5636727.1 methyltetrahydrofolate cobalamin methyltransferase [Atribacterota bacterium]